MLVKKEDCKAEFNVEDMNFWKKHMNYALSVGEILRGL